jgi:hypothetical protein
MKKLVLFIGIALLAGSQSQAQYSRYIVKFKNKGSSPYSFSNPSAFLSQRAIDRRTRYNIALDSTDLPCTPAYVNQVKNVANVTLLNVSKWLNGVTIQTSDPNALTTISGFSFVQSVSGIAARYATGTPDSLRPKFETDFLPLPNPVQRGEGTTGDYFNYGTNAYNEMHLHNAEFLHNIGMRGQGMQIAMLDNGFNNYLSPSFHAFDSCNANNQVLGGWDFIAGNAIVNDDGSHGMSCFSAIVANIPGTFVGTAPKANFWLYQTEDNSSEYPIEEFNWSCGAERADSSGADVISTSLGYNTFDNAALNHTYADMNGNTTMCAIAADLAAKKGILVFAAVGNSGGDSWHYLLTPSDGDSVIAVGAVNTSGVVAGFSSYGPSYDGRVKPDMAAVGSAAIVQNGSGGISLGNGTSFATPKMAGMGTCLWQAFPEFNNMKIRSALWKAGNIYATPDNRIGYGIPNLKLAFTNLLVDFATSTSSRTGCTITLNWTSKDVDAMKYEIERKAPGDLTYSKIADVNPQAGTLLSTHSYQYNNNLTSGSSGTFSYRIRQIIDTAAATFTAAYIDTTNITISSPCIVTGTIDPNVNATKIRLQPNVTSGQTALVVETSFAIPNMPVAIYNMDGRLMLKLFLSKNSGRATFNLPVDKLAAGRYIIKVYQAEKLLGSANLIRL